MYRQLKRMPKRYGAMWFLAGLFMGVLYGSRGERQRGATSLPSPDSPAALPGMDIEADASEAIRTLNSTHIAARSLSGARVWIEKPAGYLLDDNLDPMPCFDDELIERAWKDESRRVRISYLDNSYAPVYPKDATHVLSTVFLPVPLRTEDGTGKFFTTRLFRKVKRTLFRERFTDWHRSTFLPPAAPEGFLWFPVLNAGRPVYSSYDAAVEGHLRALEDLAEEGRDG